MQECRLKEGIKASSLHQSTFVERDELVRNSVLRKIWVKVWEVCKLKIKMWGRLQGLMEYPFRYWGCQGKLANKIQSIIECSQRKRKVPHEWRVTIVVPIFQGRNKENPSNYRPVSIMSVEAKFCKKLLKDRWMTCFWKTDSLTRWLFGFRNGRSCAMNLLCFYPTVVDGLQQRNSLLNSVVWV